jgi:Glyoxalase/Bleomycin resistance protein/Dioxygenase superfamily
VPDAPPTTPTIDEIEVGDEPETWAGAGFTVDPDGACRVGQTRLRLVGRERGKGILGWTLRDVATVGLESSGDLDGLVTQVSRALPPEPAVHPIGARLIDHVVVASPDRQRSTRAFEAAGFVARRVRHTDSYGAPMSQTFFRAGEVIIELVSLEGGEPSEGPSGFFGLALTVDDLDAAAARLGPVLGQIKSAVQPGRRIATVRHRDLGLSVAIALMSPDPG